MAMILTALEEHKQAVVVTLRNAHKLLEESVLDAVRVLHDIVNDDNAEDKDRLRAAGMIMDRVLGKAPERIDVSVYSARMEAAFEAMLVPDDDSVIEGEVVEDEDEPLQ